MKVYVIQSKNGIMANAGVSVNSSMIGVLVKIIICKILVREILNVISHVKFTNVLILKIAHAKNVYLVN